MFLWIWLISWKIVYFWVPIMQSGNIRLICTCNFMIIVLLSSPMRNLLGQIKSPIVNELKQIAKWKIWCWDTINFKMILQKFYISKITRLLRSYEPKSSRPLWVICHNTPFCFIYDITVYPFQNKKWNISNTSSYGICQPSYQ